MGDERNLRSRKVTTNLSRTDLKNKIADKPLITKNKTKQVTEVVAIPSGNPHRTSITRASISQKKVVIPTAAVLSKNRISLAQPSNTSPAPRESTLKEKFNTLEDRLKKIEDNYIQESRLSRIETEFNQLRTANLELQLTVDRLKVDIEGLQFITVQLCASEDKVNELETHCSRLITENRDLKSEFTNLEFSLKQEVDKVRSATSASDNGISFEQQELNANIVIRGVEVKEEANETELLTVYQKICANLGIANTPDFQPVAAKLLSSGKVTNTATSKPIQIKLRSTSAKRKFLQVRRIKRDIFPGDIGIVQQSRNPLLITEELTRKNQELLYQARSLRGRDRFKFVWSNNGQVLARTDHNSKVIRIVDINHINLLRTEFHLPPLIQNGRNSSSTSERIGQSQSHS